MIMTVLSASSLFSMDPDKNQKPEYALQEQLYQKQPVYHEEIDANELRVKTPGRECRSMAPIIIWLVPLVFSQISAHTIKIL